MLGILVKQLAEMSMFVKQVADKHCQSVTFDSPFFSDARTADSRSVQSFAILKIMTIIRGKNMLETGRRASATNWAFACLLLLFHEDAF